MQNNEQIKFKKDENYFYPKNFWQNFGVLYNHIKKKEKEFTNLLYIFTKLSMNIQILFKIFYMIILKFQMIVLQQKE